MNVCCEELSEGTYLKMEKKTDWSMVTWFNTQNLFLHNSKNSVLISKPVLLPLDIVPRGKHYKRSEKMKDLRQLENCKKFKILYFCQGHIREKRLKALFSFWQSCSKTIGKEIFVYFSKTSGCSITPKIWNITIVRRIGVIIWCWYF